MMKKEMVKEHNSIFYSKRTLISFSFIFSDFQVLLLEPFLEAVVKKERFKVPYYVETVVGNYIDDDFIMHFRLSRAVANDLVSRFAASTTYSSLRGLNSYL